jgi:hypothetical protein
LEQRNIRYHAIKRAKTWLLCMAGPATSTPSKGGNSIFSECWQYINFVISIVHNCRLETSMTSIYIRTGRKQPERMLIMTQIQVLFISLTKV